MKRETLEKILVVKGAIITALVLITVYCVLAYLSHGNDEWWYIDFVSGSNIYWGDDAYRYFLARSVWHNVDVFWFSFILPGAAFLDGVVTALSSDSIFYARALKSLPVTASIFLVYYTALRLGAGRAWAGCGAALLACMPLYVLVGLSFYGEAWFAFLVALSLYLVSHQQWRWAAVIFGLMPLVRLEGLYFTGGFVVYALAHRDWRNAVLPLVPGLVYGLLVIVLGPGIPVFLAWRFELVKVYEAVGIWYGGALSQVFDIFFWPWLLCSVVALCSSRARALLPCVIGMAGVFLFQVAISIILEIGRFEPRHLVALCPVLAVGFSLFMTGQGEFWKKRRAGLVFKVIAPGFVITILFAQLGTLHVVKELHAYFAANLALPEVVRAHPFQLATYFKKADAETVDGYREYADVAMRMIELNPSIETLIVSSPHVLYFLDPARIPDSTQLVFAVFGKRTLDPVLGRNGSAGYFASPPFFSRFSLGYPRPESRLLLYLDEMDLPRYPYHWNVRGNDIYLFSGKRIVPED